MLQFTEAQIDDISVRHDRRVRESLARRLREAHAPDLERLGVSPTDPQAQLAFLDRAAERAAQLGMDDERPMRAFVAIAIMNARHRGSETNATLAWVRALLERADADGASKLALIEHEAQRLAPRDPHAADLLALIRSLCGPAA